MLVAAVVATCSLGTAREARATLGGDVVTVASNQQQLRASRSVAKLAWGERHDLVLPSGVVVHQYVSPSGAVYALSWKGPRMPDLRELMGAYFSQITQGNVRTGAGHHQAHMVGTDFVMHSTGHQHSFQGRAWVPSLVPQGVDLDAVIQ